MTVLTGTLTIISLSVIVLLHIITAIFDNKISKILEYVNVTLHIALVLALLYDGVPIEEAPLAFMISLFVYTLTRAVSGYLRRGGGNDL